MNTPATNIPELFNIETATKRVCNVCSKNMNDIEGKKTLLKHRENNVKNRSYE